MDLVSGNQIVAKVGLEYSWKPSCSDMCMGYCHHKEKCKKIPGALMPTKNPFILNEECCLSSPPLKEEPVKVVLPGFGDSIGALLIKAPNSFRLMAVVEGGEVQLDVRICPTVSGSQKGGILPGGSSVWWRLQEDSPVHSRTGNLPLNHGLKARGNIPGGPVVSKRHANLPMGHVPSRNYNRRILSLIKENGMPTASLDELKLDTWSYFWAENWESTLVGYFLDMDLVSGNQIVAKVGLEYSWKPSFSDMCMGYCHHKEKCKKIPGAPMPTKNPFILDEERCLSSPPLKEKPVKVVLPGFGDSIGALLIKASNSFRLMAAVEGGEVQADARICPTVSGSQKGGILPGGSSVWWRLQEDSPVHSRTGNLSLNHDTPVDIFKSLRESTMSVVWMAAGVADQVALAFCI
ncbi:hypothetical protein Nepgr_024670 [Nepenthes gracilis]|uniref:Uncharacterized protein n=1 Tax=Nepenthes gracilis TaxID=150966 RepID=A0AAD3XYU5_NEPGR|nr:hypothetical protein Nepgr_024670 [Nepenthes gracilis]